jgi:hypothetical protein
MRDSDIKDLSAYKIPGSDSISAHSDETNVSPGKNFTGNAPLEKDTNRPQVMLSKEDALSGKIRENSDPEGSFFAERHQGDGSFLGGSPPRAKFDQMKAENVISKAQKKLMIHKLHPWLLHTSHMVRLYALHVFERLWTTLTEEERDEMPEGYRNVATFVDQSPHCRKILDSVDVRVRHPLLDRSFDPFQDFTLAKIFSILPRYPSERISTVSLLFYQSILCTINISPWSCSV